MLPRILQASPYYGRLKILPAPCNSFHAHAIHSATIAISSEHQEWLMSRIPAQVAKACQGRQHR